ncbi:MAG TPA: RNA polymerase-binding ATPase, partial [Prosthecobacter sp.]|nr:RNA polymerase-binding ATPase [Prosthecobacter sp.]
QTTTIHIHVPYIKGSGEEVLARWYHEGLHAIEKNLHGATEIVHSLREDLTGLLESPKPAALKAFIKKSQELRKAVTHKLERGHDRLLELNSCKPDRAEAVIEAVRAQDADTEFEEFFIRLVDQFGLHVEEHGNRSYVLMPAHLTTDKFPALPDEGLLASFDRGRALSRENMAFLTQDHPMVRGVLDLLLGAETGNSSFGLWRGAGSEGLMLECHFVVECIAPPALHVDRFLSATPIRIVVDHAGKDRRQDTTYALAKIEKGSPNRLLENAGFKRKIFPTMLSKSRKLAEGEMQKLAAEATAAMKAQLQAEIDRLEDLRQINDHVRPEEIEAAKSQMAALEEAILSARLRLDALRLVLQST